MIIASNETFMLRHLEENDLKPLALLANNAKIAINVRDMFPHPYELKHAYEFYTLTKKQNPQSSFAIEYKSEFAGMIGLTPQDDVYRKSAEIGYWLGEPYWNKGIMTAAVTQTVEWGWRNLDIVRIYTGVFSYNKASARVLEKAGFTFEGEFIHSVYKNGIMANELRYSLLKPI